MGSAYAVGIAEAISNQAPEMVRAGIVSHLRGNCYPPLPEAYADEVIKAIALYESEEPEVDIDLSEFIQANPGAPLPKRVRLDDDAKVVVSAADLLEATHTWDFVGSMSDYDWEDQNDIDDDAYHGPRHPSDYLPKDDD